MGITDQIQARRSTRAYSDEPLIPDHVEAIRGFVASTMPPWGVTARIDLVHTDYDGQPRKLGTYGSVKGARDFLGLAYRDGPLAAEAAAYWFEQVILLCTGLGIATCWLAGFTRSSFQGVFTPGDTGPVQYASPVGYPGGTKSALERFGLINSERLHMTKKPFGTLFLRDDFITPLTPEDAGNLALPLQMMRLAPSAKNLQPYRVTVADGRVDFFTAPTRFGHTDIGIALAHFDLTCAELAVPGHLAVLENHPVHDGFDYVMSWT